MFLCLLFISTSRAFANTIKIVQNKRTNFQQKKTKKKIKIEDVKWVKHDLKTEFGNIRCFFVCIHMKLMEKIACTKIQC